MIWTFEIDAQSNPEGKPYPCKNQFEVDYIGYEQVLGSVESLNIERETLVSRGDFLFTNKGKPYIFATYRYDRIGRLIEKNFYRLDGVPLPKSTFDYDSNGRLVKENSFSAITKKPYLETIYNYENDLLKETIGRDIEKNDWLSKKVFSYDVSKNTFEFVETKSYKSPTEHVGFKQDERCRFVEIYGYDVNGKLRARNLITFDANNNPTLLTSLDQNGKILGKRKYEYKFDIQGNWTEQSEFSWDQDKWTLVEIGYRKIKYFDKQ